MTDAVLIQAITGVVTLLVACVGAVVSIMNNRAARVIHKAVNSTATQMAADLSAEQDKNSMLSARVARLEERAEGKQTAQDLKDAAR